MKNIFLTLIGVALIAPYFVGRLQYSNTIRVYQNLGFETDGDIENILSTFDFPTVGTMDEPTTADYYNAGVKAILQTCQLYK